VGDPCLAKWADGEVIAEGQAGLPARHGFADLLAPLNRIDEPALEAGRVEAVVRTYRLERVQTINRPLDEVFEFFSNAENLQKLTPRFLDFSIKTPLPIAMFAGARIEYRLGLFGIPMRWLTVISAWDPPRVDPATGRRVAQFIDQQVSGPYAVWKHLHEFEEVDGRTIMRDVVDYAVPFGPLGAVARWAFVSRTLDRIFAFRFEATAHAFENAPAPWSPSVVQVALETAVDVTTEVGRAVASIGRTTLKELSTVNPMAPVAVSGASQGRSGTESAPFDVEVFFDGDCPLCLREIKMLRWLDKRNRIRFTNIAAPDFDPRSAGLSMFELMDRIHGRLPDGTPIEGVEVFRQLYGAVGFRRAVQVSRWPGVAHALHLGYVLFAKNRLRLTGRCIEDVCAVPANFAPASPTYATAPSDGVSMASLPNVERLPSGRRAVTPPNHDVSPDGGRGRFENSALVAAGVS
jgi:ligand-binding SRPBCC domain-containing protein/predicted DCC family thiol-disulfide oxidoreductase YuxK